MPIWTASPPSTPMRWRMARPRSSSIPPTGPRWRAAEPRFWTAAIPISWRSGTARASASSPWASSGHRLQAWALALHRADAAPPRLRHAGAADPADPLVGDDLGLVEHPQHPVELMPALQDQAGRDDDRIGALPLGELRVLFDPVEGHLRAASEDGEHGLVRHEVDGVVAPFARGNL